MPKARNLRELLLIRDTSREKLEAINGTLGTALGRKHTRGRVGEPAIIVFVPRKVDMRWVPSTGTIPETLSGPNGLTCPVDVVEGGVDDVWLRTVNPITGYDGPPRSWLRLRDEHQTLSSANIDLREQLRGWSKQLGPGSQIGGMERGRGYFGTLGCLARHRRTRRLGFLTNQHVGKRPGRILYHPDPGTMPIGETLTVQEFLRDEERFAGVVDEPNARFRVDCAYAVFRKTITRQDLDPRLPVLSDDGTLERRVIGEPIPLDLDTMSPIGTRVVGVGRTSSYQRGTITAFAYEHRDEEDDARYTDYLIAGDDSNPFSQPGDSGKIILTDESIPRPIALLWGGSYEKLRPGKDQEKWSYAIDINVVLHLLDVDIVSEL